MPGPGIAEAERALVLKRFYRSERSRSSEGDGLGLALVAAVARLHGFALRISDNRPGCSVEIIAPAVSRQGPSASTPVAARGGMAPAPAAAQGPEMES